MIQAKKLEAYQKLSDEEVLLQAQKDPDAFAVLVERYEAPFMRKALSILRQREEAEEAVQDAFTRIYVYADRYKAQEGANFGSWGYMILTRLCFTRYQKMKKLRGRTAEMEPEAYERLPDTDSFVADLSMRNEVLVGLSKIPESAARILRLQFLEGKTQEEIAEIEGSTVSAVKTRVHRAKKAFKEVLAYDGHD
ncbi:RNA polymerase sigma factor [Patescibacteria group bacterium]|nr:RNA polymerase sigma factor [Patescibacteria group bacterium]